MMPDLNFYQYFLIYSSIAVVLLVSGFKLLFFINISLFNKKNPSLLARFPIPNLILFFFTSVLLLATLVFSYISLFQTSANEAELSSSQKSVDILFIVDVSLSMNATDVFPTRLKRAQDVLLRLAPDLIGNRVGVLVFAGSAFSFCPMTSDLTAYADYVNAMGVDMIGKKGTDISTAFEKANELLSSTKILKNRIVVLISDGEDHESSNINKLDADLMVWGIGSEEGGSIFFGDENSKTSGYVTINGSLTQDNKSTEIVNTKINEQNLLNISKVNNGDYYNISQESFGAYKLLDKIDTMKKNQTILLQKIRKEDGAAIYLILAVACFFAERILRLFYFHKKSLIILFLFLIVHSFELKAWDLDPGGKSVKEGVKLYEEGNYQDSESKFRDAEEYFKDDRRLKFNQADNDYKKGNYGEAIKKNNSVIEDPLTDKELKSKALFNNGNASFKLKDLKSAQTFYEETLKMNPNHEGAKKNLELIHKKPPQSNQNSNEPQADRDKDKNESKKQSKKNQNSPQSKDKQNEKENADRMMDHFSPDAILKNKSQGGGNLDNEKFW